jgi:hypothetical protein
LILTFSCEASLSLSPAGRGRSAFQLGRDLRQVAALEARAGVRRSEQAFAFSPTGARFYIIA